MRLSRATYAWIVVFVLPTTVVGQAPGGPSSEEPAAAEAREGDQPETQGQTPKPYPETVPVEPAGGEDSPPISDGDSATRLDEIVVTATKREESPRALASSVSVLTGDEMENLGLRDVEDIVNQVPGLTISDLQQGATPKRITVRGISADFVTASTTGVFLDETPFNDATAPQAVLDVNPFDLYSVEVLKGPVGTLFGGSGLNGAIRFIPTPPTMSEWEFRAFAEAGVMPEGDVSQTYGGAINLPLLGRDDLALRLVATDRHSSGYMDSVHPEYMKENINTTDQQAQRAILRWEPLTRLIMSFMYVNQETLLDDIVRFTEKCCESLERTATPRPSPSLSKYQIYNVKGTWAFDWADLVVNLAQLDKEGDVQADFSYLADEDSPPPTAKVPSVFNGTSHVQEVRLVSSDDGGRWDWLVGLFNYRYGVDVLSSVEYDNDTQGTPALIADGDFKIAEQALFGEVNWRFAEDFQLTGGVRGYRFAYDIFNETKGAGCVLVDPACPTTGFVATSHLTSTEPGINPKLSLKWQARPNLLSYFTLAKGFRFGGVNLIPHPESPTTYKSDSLWNLEAGTRSEWFDRTLITDLTAFALRWSDAQVAVTTSDGATTFIDNVGQVDGRGVEAQVIWFTPLTGVRLTVVPAYADIHTAAQFNSGSQQVPAGTPWPFAPKLQTSTTLSWAGTLFDATQVDVGLTHRYSSKALQQLTNRLEVFGFSTLGLQITAKPLSAGYWPELAINLNNLTDVRGETFKRLGLVTGTPLTAYNEPRSATLRLTFHF